MRTIWKTLVLLMILSGSAAALIPLPNAYDRGYYDGCETAKGHYKKAGSLYRHNADYRRGWQQGKRKCASGNHNTGNDHGHHYTYNQGYSDGCKSAKGHWRKNAKAYRKSSQYRQGWNEGFQKCKFGNQHDQGNLFQKGFDDGCSTARGHYRKNKRLYRTSQQYRRGWYSGKSSCTLPGGGGEEGDGHAGSNYYYNQGYSDGCQSAKGHYKKDDKAYRHSLKYRRGWKAGYRACRSDHQDHSGNSYRQGYRDGCKTARGEYRRNETLYRNDRKYRQGWNDGKRRCSSDLGSQWDSYQKGYRDGCRSARGSWHKNERAYHRYRNYREGWDEGYRKCRNGEGGDQHHNFYNQGYSDGCQSARGHYKRDRTLYQNNSDYRRGWNDGKRRCKPENDGHWDAYRKGYHDGCRTARGHYRRDYRLYRNNSDYRQGWNDGKRECRESEGDRYTYERGYRDGCRSAQGSWHRDENAYRNHERYRRGWDAGNRACRQGYDLGDFYWRGYRDGCRSGQGHWYKDGYAYSHYSNYRRGWHRGWEDCASWNDSGYWYGGGLGGWFDLGSHGASGSGGTQYHYGDEQIISGGEAGTQNSSTRQAPENPLIDEIRKMLLAAHHYMLAHYLKEPPLKPVGLEVLQIEWEPGFGLVQAHPITESGKRPPERIIDDRRFLFCLDQDPSTGEWRVLYDLSYETLPDPQTLEEIRRTFPQDYPLHLLPQKWQELLTPSPLTAEPKTIVPAPPTASPSYAPKNEGKPAPSQTSTPPAITRDVNTSTVRRTKERNSTMERTSENSPEKGEKEGNGTK